MAIIEDFEKELATSSEPTFGRWHAVDLHNHSPTSHDFQGNKDTAVDDAAQHLRDSLVDIVMFTDHEQLPKRQFTEEVAKRSGKTVLRGAELNVFVDAWFKPANKIEKNMFFHLLVGFDPEGQQDPDYWLTHLQRKCAHEVRASNGNQVQGFTASIDEICDTLEPSGAIIIPAHLHKKSDPFRSRSVDDIFTDKEFIRLARNRFTALEVTDPITAEYFDGNHEETDKLLKTCIRSSDAHEVASIGNRVTYVQMEKPTFAELKAGLQMPFRVSLKEPDMPESYIVGLHVKGRFFSDLWLSFSPNCNAFIGVKGSGKTSILECLRFALGSPVPQSREEEVNAHLQNILGPSGIVRVLIKRKDGAKVLVKRSINNFETFELIFENDRHQEVKNPDALMFPSYILGWHEIEQAATEPKIRQVYLDTIAGREQIRQLKENADAKASQVRYLHEQVANRYSQFRALHEQVKRLEDLRAGLQVLTEAKLIQLRDSYETAIRQRDVIEKLVPRLRASAETLNDRAETFLVPAESSLLEGNSPLSGFARNATEALEELKSSVNEFVGHHRTLLQSAIDKLEAQSPDLRQAFENFTQTYFEAISELTPEQQRLLETHRKVMDDTRALPELAAQKKAEKEEVERLLSSLIDVCNQVAEALDAQTKLRTEKIGEFNNQLLDYGVNLQVAPLAQRSAFDDLFKQNTTGANIFNELNSLVPHEKRHHRRLASAYEELKNNLIDGSGLIFSSPEFLSFLGAFEEDDLKISLDVGKAGETYSSIDQLSAGQRCTAVFPLLLMLREGPLIVDQPEDNLDNRHISESIAPALLADKRKRQIAFTSHNANLVVLADAEQIVMFEGSGSSGVVDTRGFLCISKSPITPKVIAILDGGEKALRLRYQKYGIREP